MSVRGARTSGEPGGVRPRPVLAFMLAPPVAPVGALPVALLVALLVVLGGCTAVQTYDGERRGRDEVARLSGDLPFSAGAPVTVILRQVDGRQLTLGQNTIELLPGEHRLLVDCRIAETKATTRHALEVEVSAGRQYRLAAELAPGLRECSTVTVEAVN